MNKNKLGCRKFAEQLLITNDLDPVYVILWNWKNKSIPTLRNWLLAYWCFYHMGTASWIAESKTEITYWKKMRIAAGSKTYPRCTERRHFRGNNAKKSISYLQSIGVDKLFEPFIEMNTCKQVMDYTKTWVGFGPWISFKIADMLEALELARIEFDLKSVYLFDSPKQGAEKLLQSLKLVNKPTNIESWAVSEVMSWFKDKKAPPSLKRNFGIQEAETVLCKWKSHLSGKYQIGEDIETCKKSLMRFCRQSRIAQDLLQSGGQQLW